MLEPLLRPDDPSEPPALRYGRHAIIPNYAYDAHAWSVFLSLLRNGHIFDRKNPDLYADLSIFGPAMKMALESLAVKSLSYLLLPCVVYVMTPSQKNHKGFAIGPLFIYFLGICIIFWLMRKEEKIRKFSIILHATRCSGEEGFKIMGRTLSFPQWVWLMRCLSLSALSKMVTAAVFIGRTARTFGYSTAGQPSKIMAAWHHMMSLSLAPWLKDLSFFFWASIGYACYGLEILFCLAGALPIRTTNLLGMRRTFNFDLPDSSFVFPPEILVYSTCLKQQASHMDSLSMLADTINMASVTDQQFKYWLGSFYPPNNPLYLEICARDEKYATLNLRSEILPEMRRTVIRFFVAMVLPTAYNMQIQASALGLAKFDDGNLDYQILSTIFFTIVMGLKATRSESVKIYQLRKLAIETNPNACRVQRDMLLVACIFANAIFFFAVMRVSLQIAGLMQCETGLYNMNSGCVT